jgi:hypothetical protein
MNFSSIAHVLHLARDSIELKVGAGNKKTRVTGTPCSEFLKYLCVLIPSDLLLSQDLSSPPVLQCCEFTFAGTTQDDYLLRRYKDVGFMITRVMVFFSMKLPIPNEGNAAELQALQDVKSFFEALGRINDVCIGRILNKPQHVSHSTSHINMGNCDGCFLYCDCPCRCCIYSCEYCFRGVHAINHQFYLNKGVADHAAGNGFHGGLSHIATGEAQGYYGAALDAQCYSLCSEVCGGKFADTCCCCYNVDSGTAAAMNGTSAPKDCCGQIGYHSAKCVGEVQQCQCNCLTHLFDLCKSCSISCLDGTLGLLQGCVRLTAGFLHNCCFSQDNCGKFLLHCCDLPSDGFEACSHGIKYYLYMCMF